jgi:TM2 domain-containing membrane protein YozV
MSSNVQVSSRNVATLTAKQAEKSSALGYGALILGWLIPGAGHFLVKRPVRGLLLFLSITSMFVLGVAMQGKLYSPNAGEILNILGFVGDLGAGLLYIVAKALDYGHAAVQVVTADYGTKFAVVAGLLNFICAIDAHNIAIGRKS